MGYLIDRINSWMTYEPVIGLLMIISAIVLFISVYKKDKEQVSPAFWPWLRRLIEAVAITVLFLGLLWAFRSMLNDNYDSFRQSHGRVSQVNYSSVQKIWGSPHVQRELKVQHFVKNTYQEQIPQSDPSKPPLYKNVTRIEEIEQNSILNSIGEAKLKLSKRKKGSAYYNGFIAEFSMSYQIINDSNRQTDAHFTFPLDSGQLIYDPFEVRLNEESISRNLRFSSSSVSWKKTMTPGEKVQIKVSYRTRGLEYFYYQIPYPREIKNFLFKIHIDKLPVSQINYPEGCLPPEKNSIKPTGDGQGSILSWKFNNTLTTAGMGIALPQPTQPGAKVAMVLKNSPYALMLLVVAICLTFLIQGRGINFLEISLLSASYYLLFVMMSSVSDFWFGFWGSLWIGSLLTLVLTFILYRRHDKVNLALVMSFVGFFTLIYPMSSLFPDYQDTFDGLVTVILVIYLFTISWYFRLRQ